MRTYIVALGCIVLLGACSEEYFPNAPKMAAGKIAVEKFTPDSDTNYDPFKGMDRKARFEAIGGAEGATAYYELITVQLAQALQDKKAREILHANIPEWEKGEAKIAQVAAVNPELLRALSRDFKAEVDQKGISNQLSKRIHASQSDEKAMLEVVEAMFDLEVNLVNPPDSKWDGDSPIPVFYIPVEQGATVISGVDVALNAVTLDAELETPPYSLLQINFDEDTLVPDIHGASTTGINWMREIEDLLNPVSTAWAHAPHDHGNGYCLHTNIIQPVKKIKIRKDHEPGWNKPEIWLIVKYSHSQLWQEEIELPKVDKENKWYSDYASKRTKHGTCGERIRYFHVIEEDVGWNDNVCRWDDVWVNASDTELTPGDADDDDKDAWLVVRRTTEDSD